MRVLINQDGQEFSWKTQPTTPLDERNRMMVLYSTTMAFYRSLDGLMRTHCLQYVQLHSHRRLPSSLDSTGKKGLVDHLSWVDMSTARYSTVQ